MSEDISVVRLTELSDKDSFKQQSMSFTFGVKTKPVSGVLKLVQMVTKLMLTTPGTDKFAIETGTIVQNLLKRAVTSGSAQLMKMEVTVSLRDLERQINDIQGSESIPDDERLKELNIRRVEFLPASTEWIIEISVLSEAGEGVVFDIAPYLKGK
jgi:phage baseplate assembly protein W